MLDTVERIIWSKLFFQLVGKNFESFKSEHNKHDHIKRKWARKANVVKQKTFQITHKEFFIPNDVPLDVEAKVRNGIHIALLKVE